MPDPYTAAWQEAVATNDKEGQNLETLELIHSAFIENGQQVSVRAVNDLVEHTFRLEPDAPRNAGQDVVFSRIPFSFDHPDSVEGQGPSCRITVGNIRSEVEKYLDMAETSSEGITIIYRIYSTKNPTVVALGPWTFLVREIDTKGSDVSGAATLGKPQNEKFPTRFLTADFAPALVHQASAT